MKTIQLSLPYGFNLVNCYLLKTEAGFILIDTGSSNQRASLVEELERSGCQPGNLRLIVITHGDFDHTGNAAYQRGKFDTKIAMHVDDAAIAVKSIEKVKTQNVRTVYPGHGKPFPWEAFLENIR